VLFCEEPEYAAKIEYMFTYDGLKNGQNCCFISNHDRMDIPFMEANMADAGIDIAKYRAEGLLHFMVLNSQKDNPDHGISGRLLRNLSRIPRWSRVVYLDNASEIISGNIISREKIELQADLKQAVHELGALWICHYEVQDIHSILDTKGMAEFLMTHDAAIYLPRGSSGIAMTLADAETD
jgi:hypothetical protein